VLADISFNQISVTANISTLNRVSKSWMSEIFLEIFVDIGLRQFMCMNRNCPINYRDVKKLNDIVQNKLKNSH